MLWTLKEAKRLNQIKGETLLIVGKREKVNSLVKAQIALAAEVCRNNRVVLSLNDYVKMIHLNITNGIMAE